MTAREWQAAHVHAAGPARGPVWRALLEAQWRARLQEVTELSLAYHEAAAAAPHSHFGDGRPGAGHSGTGRSGDGRPGSGRPASGPPGGGESGPGQSGDRNLRRLLRRAVAARRALADTDDALGRLASGRYGLCEGCAAAIPPRLLAAVPDLRYCQRCRPRRAWAIPALAAGPVPGRR